MAEVGYLNHLCCLRQLNLLCNPVCQLPDYRLAVIFTLPHLTHLDSLLISIEDKVTLSLFIYIIFSTNRRAIILYLYYIFSPGRSYKYRLLCINSLQVGAINILYYYKPAAVETFGLYCIGLYY